MTLHVSCDQIKLFNYQENYMSHIFIKLSLDKCHTSGIHNIFLIFTVVSGVTSSTKTHTDKPSRETQNDSPDTNTAHSLVDVEMGLNESQNFQTDTDHVAEDESNIISEAETSQSARNGMGELSLFLPTTKLQMFRMKYMMKKLPIHIQ